MRSVRGPPPGKGSMLGGKQQQFLATKVVPPRCPGLIDRPRLVDATSQVGGGALPTVELPTAALALGTRERPAQVLDEQLRNGQPPVLGRVLDDRLLLDFRTILPSDIPALTAALTAL